MGPHLPSATRQLGQMGGHGHPVTTHRQPGRRAGQGVQLLQIQRHPESPGSASARAASSPKAGGGPGRGQPREPPPHTHGPLHSCLVLQPESGRGGLLDSSFQDKNKRLKRTSHQALLRMKTLLPRGWRQCHLDLTMLGACSGLPGRGQGWAAAHPPAYSAVGPRALSVVLTLAPTRESRNQSPDQHRRKGRDPDTSPGSHPHPGNRFWLHCHLPSSFRPWRGSGRTGMAQALAPNTAAGIPGGPSPCRLRAGAHGQLTLRFTLSLQTRLRG